MATCLNRFAACLYGPSVVGPGGTAARSHGRQPVVSMPNLFISRETATAATPDVRPQTNTVAHIRLRGVSKNR